MSYHIAYILFILAICSCKAQTVPLDTYGYLIEDGSYVKDLDNELDKFVGTWVFNNNNTTFTLSIQKLIHDFNGEYYEDYLIGEYAYSENDIELINTLSELPEDNNNTNSQGGLGNDNNIPENTNFNIGGRYIVTGQRYNCNDCLDNERRIKFYFSDPQRRYLSTNLILRYLVNETNPEKITATIRARDGGIIPEDGFTAPRVPYGTYIMEKQ